MFGMGIIDIIILVMVIVGIGGAAFFFLSRWSYKKMDEHTTLVDAHRQAATIFVIDKQRGRIKPGLFPKAVMDAMPITTKLIKMNFVKAKVGPQIMTLMCERNIYDALPMKKNVKVELAGIYIASMHGLKSKAEMKAMKKAQGKK